MTMMLNMFKMQPYLEISPENALMKNYDNDKICIKNVYFLKLTGNFPYEQEIVLIDRNIMKM